MSVKHIFRSNIFCFKFRMQSQKLQSRVWSSSDLLLGASHVVDMAAFPAGQMLNADAAAIQLEIGDLSVEELEQLMEDISLVAFMCC